MAQPSAAASQFLDSTLWPVQAQKQLSSLRLESTDESDFYFSMLGVHYFILQTDRWMGLNPLVKF